MRGQLVKRHFLSVEEKVPGSIKSLFPRISPPSCFGFFIFLYLPDKSGPDATQKVLRDF
jgi:hypothetical protein